MSPGLDSPGQKRYAGNLTPCILRICSFKAKKYVQGTGQVKNQNVRIFTAHGSQKIKNKKPELPQFENATIPRAKKLD